MKILAVIPARAGSKGIPNKNIRLLGNRPLIYYAINNALKSRYITDVIISTDSPEVRIIANQMGAKCHWRDKSLCGDSVTLDSVVYDASNYDEWDYIITMQPTSPTLTVQTLDSAIEYIIDNKFDTLISAINEPHLSWGIHNGKLAPNYEKRLNRQYLPPCYKETGAFLISKAEFVTADSRIGSNVGIYELPRDESQDIDTFSDLQTAAFLIEKQAVAIYVNGNSERGMGHIYRALEIADEFYTKPDIYYDINQTNSDIFGSTTHNLVPVNGITELYEHCKEKKYTIFINDILSTSIDYMIGLRTVIPNAKIINFEDDGAGILEADLVFNALYSDNGMPNVYSGEKYYISGKTFMFYEPIKIQKDVKRVLIAFGGADPQNYTERLLKIVSKDEYKGFNFIVVIGRAKSEHNDIMAYNSYPNIDVYYDVSNMPELMSQCDIAVTSRGRTGYELAMLGIPSIAMSQNRREEKHNFICEENGFTYLGLDPDDEIIEANLNIYLKLSQKSRQNLQNILLSHDLRNGRKRVMGFINNF